MTPLLFLVLCFLIGVAASTPAVFLPGWLFLQTAASRLSYGSTASSAKHVWIVWIIFLLLWVILFGLVKPALLGLKSQLVFIWPRYFSFIALFSPSVVPYRAYPLSCCLLQ